MNCPSCGHDNLPGAEDCVDCQEPLSQLDRPQAVRGMQKKILEGTVGQLKPKEALFVQAEDKVADALALMRKDKVGCVLVLDGKKLKGLLSEREILLNAAGKAGAEQLAVSAVMQPDPEVLKEKDPINVAFHRMAVGGYRHLPVARENGGFRILSARDFLRFLCE